MAEITGMVVADPPELWTGLGFVVHDRACWIDGIRYRLGAPGRGVVGWTLHGTDELSELPAVDGAATEVPPPVPHPNGVTVLDHVVVITPDLARTTGAFESAGLRLRRTRDAGSPQRPMTQAFFKVGPTIVEVVGSPTRAEPGPARFYGLAFTVADLDATAAFLGERLRPARDAVQAGRSIATLDRAAGSTVALAFMSIGPPAEQASDL